MEEIKKHVGKRLREIREEKGVTQKQLGDLLKYSPMGISHFENGIRDLKLSDLKKIAQFFKVELSYFFPENKSVDVTFFRFNGKDNPAVQKSLQDFESHLEKNENNNG